MLAFSVYFEEEPVGFAKRFMWDVRESQVNHDSKPVALNWG